MVNSDWLASIPSKHLVPMANTSFALQSPSMKGFARALVFSFNELWHCAITPGRKSSHIPPGYLISGILSADIPFTRIPHIRNLVRRHSIRPDISHPESCPPTFHPPGYLTSGILSAGWERRTIQLPRADMSGSFGNAYPECSLDLSTIPTLSSWGLNHQTSRLSLLSA
uniref:Uncharacterized protein n=1 Tax=Vitis vinifera TaxID=29760 RepID=A5C8N0_VITVI|nr:hypothetical protein VITISV_040804 [Vitis vinifera]